MATTRNEEVSEPCTSEKSTWEILCCCILVPRAIWQRKDENMKTDYTCGILEACKPESYRVKCESFFPFTLLLLIFGPIALMPLTDSLREEPYNWPRLVTAVISYVLVAAAVFLINFIIYHLSCPRRGAFWRRYDDNLCAVRVCVALYPLLCGFLVIGYSVSLPFVGGSIESNAIQFSLCMAFSCAIVIIVASIVTIYESCSSYIKKSRSEASKIGDNPQHPSLEEGENKA